MSKRSLCGSARQPCEFTEPQKFFPRNAVVVTERRQPRTAFRNGGGRMPDTAETFALEMFGRIERGVVMGRTTGSIWLQWQRYRDLRIAGPREAFACALKQRCTPPSPCLPPDAGPP